MHSYALHINCFVQTVVMDFKWSVIYSKHANWNEFKYFYESFVTVQHACSKVMLGWDSNCMNCVEWANIVFIWLNYIIGPIHRHYHWNQVEMDFLQNTALNENNRIWILEHSLVNTPNISHTWWTRSTKCSNLTEYRLLLTELFK